MKVLFPLQIAALLIPQGAAFAFPMASGNVTFALPHNCGELIPDYGPFMGFLEAVARSMVSSDRRLSRRLFRILALRDKLNESGDHVQELNPIDNLVRRTLCFYREQKEPIRPIVFDDPEFMKFLRASLRELEKKTEDAIYIIEFERFQRTEYERSLEKNRVAAETVQKEAAVEAERTFDRLSDTAKRRNQGK